ncbi:MAG: putative Inositol-phosphate phosphatase [Candidatus Thorarchaeota archaeon]|nr:MAG: putative Inositol-phosphate phosphatase [Candidatus Thorarchaeota archaeon]
MVKETDYLALLRETVIPGGIVLRALQGRLDNTPKESDLPEEMTDAKSTAHTIGDDLVQEIALQILSSHSTDFRINAEEETPRVKIFNGTPTSYCYHLDPLDGTLSFIQGRDGFAVGAAFSRNLKFEASAIYLPARDELYLAQRGEGVRVESQFGVEIPFEKKDPPCDKYIQRRAEKLIPVVESMDLSHLETMGAHHGMLCVAKGEARVLMYRMASPHDFGIPQVIVEEAGGICTDLKGVPVSYQTNFPRVSLFLAFTDLETKDQFFEQDILGDIDFD